MAKILVGQPNVQNWKDQLTKEKVTEYISTFSGNIRNDLLRSSIDVSTNEVVYKAEGVIELPYEREISVTVKVPYNSLLAEENNLKGGYLTVDLAKLMTSMATMLVLAGMWIRSGWATNE